MKSSYETWLEQQHYAAGTVQAQVHRAGRVEELYGTWTSTTIGISFAA